MKKLNLVKLIITVFVISWIGVLPSLLISYGIEIPSILKNLHILMILGPILGASIFIYRTSGKQGLKNLFKRLFFFKARPLVIAVAIVAPILISYLAAFFGLKISGANWPASFDAITILTNGLMVFAAYLVVNTEEIVWRGVVFDRLFEKHGFIKSCLIIAPIWWLFHIPLFLYPGGHPAGTGLLAFTLMVVSATFILSWIYVKSNRSLFYVHVHHQLINGFGQAFPIFPVLIAGNLVPVWVFSSLMVVMGIALILIKGNDNRNRKQLI
jgi:membrane protease YdiL (CAAX protease family)